MEIANQNIDIEVVETGSETAQYFWHEATGPDAGAHVTEVPQEEWSDAGDPNYHSGGNVLVQSTAVSVRDGMKDLAVMSKDGFDAKTYDAQDNEIIIAHLGYGPGSDSGSGTSDAPYYTVGSRRTNVSLFDPNATYKIGDLCYFPPNIYVCRVDITTPDGDFIPTKWRLAIGNYSFVEGENNVAAGAAAHAEGFRTTATGFQSHSEGSTTAAVGTCSHAGGYHTIANRKSQTAVGEYNVKDTTGVDEFARGKYAFIIGNGTADNARNNALTVDWNGNTDIPSGSQYKVNNKTATFDALTVTDEKFTYSAISSGGNSGTQSETYQNAGYYPLGVVGYRTGNGNAVPIRMRLSSQQSGQCTFQFYLRAVGAVSAGTGHVHILWVKE